MLTLAARNQVGTEAMEAQRMRSLLCHVNLETFVVTRHLSGPLEMAGNLGNLVGGIPTRRAW